jgi:hypothetical protein
VRRIHAQLYFIEQGGQDYLKRRRLRRLEQEKCIFAEAGVQPL